MAYLGLLEDAAPLFRSETAVPRAGVLLAIAPLLHSGVLECARDIYGTLGPAFYGLRTSLVTMLLMALLRIKRPEALKEYSPADLGRVLGLDRAPEVKTLRRKLARMAAVAKTRPHGCCGPRHRFGQRPGQAADCPAWPRHGISLCGRPRPRLPRQTHDPQGSRGQEALGCSCDQRLLGQRLARRPDFRGHRRGQRGHGEDAADPAVANPGPDRKAASDGRLRPRRLQPKTVPRSRASWLRHR